MSKEQQNLAKIVFKAGNVDRQSPILRNVCKYLAQTFARRIGVCLSVRLERPKHDAFGLGHCVVLGESKEQHYSIKGNYKPRKDESAMSWCQKTAEVVKNVISYLGLCGVVVAADHQVLVVVDKEGATVTFFEQSIISDGGCPYIEYGFTTTGIGIFEDCALPSFVAIPSVLLVCHGQCVCTKKAEIRERLGHISIHFRHPDSDGSLELIESGTPLLITSTVEGLVFTLRTLDSTLGTFADITFENVSDALEKSDKTFPEDQDHVAIYCDGCSPRTLVFQFRKFFVQGSEECNCKGSSSVSGSKGDYFVLLN